MNHPDSGTTGSLAFDGEEPEQTVVANGTSPIGSRHAGITPQIVAVVQAAAEAFLRQKVRIVSLRVAGSTPGRSNSWASQGRDIIQTSHNLVQRGR
jgi:hypothetical protein